MTERTQVNVSVALNANGLANDVASTGASYTLAAASAGDSLAHLITVLGNAVTNHAAKTFTVVGTDANGRPQSEGIDGPIGVATVTTTKYFKTVTSVTPSASTGADTFDIGWTAASVGISFMVNRGNSLPINIGIGSTVVSGSPTYSVQYTYDDSAWFTHATITGKTGHFDGVVTTPCLALRVIFAAAGGVTTTFMQHDRR